MNDRAGTHHFIDIAVVLKVAPDLLCNERYKDGDHATMGLTRETRQRRPLDEYFPSAAQESKNGRREASTFIRLPREPPEEQLHATPAIEAHLISCSAYW